MKKIFLIAIRFYQATLSPDHGVLKRIGLIRKPVCAFYPTCSEYTYQAIDRYGVGIGISKGMARIVRCHPWQKNHLDPLP